MELSVLTPPDPERDPEARSFRGALEAHLHRQHARAVRRVLMAAALLPGSVLCAIAVNPGLGGEGARGFGVYGWLTCCAAAAVAAASEWRWRRLGARLDAP